MSLIVQVQDQAFQAMLIASIETFPTSYLPQETGKQKRLKNKLHDGEAMGLLFGQRLVKGKHLVFNVSLAVTMQATKRAADGVKYSRFHFERIREITESFPNLEFLGAFHSHPWLKTDFGKKATEPSEEDEKTAIKAAQECGDELLELILGLTYLTRSNYRSAKFNGYSIDSYCGHYKYRLSAYCTASAVEDNDATLLFDEESADLGFDEIWGLFQVDQLICPLAAHGGNVFA